MAHPGGRPTIYSEEMVDKVCGAIASHSLGYERLSNLYDYLPCEATIQNWIAKYPEFLGRYLQAKRVQSHLLLDKTISIANGNEDEEDTLIKINRDKLKIDTYKFNAVRLNPMDYGERKENNIGDDAKSLLQTVIDKL